MTTYTAIVKDNHTNQLEVITREYETRQEFITDLKGNGYKIRSVRTKEHQDWIARNANDHWQTTVKYWKACNELNNGQPLNYIDWLELN